MSEQTKKEVLRLRVIETPQAIVWIAEQNMLGAGHAESFYIPTFPHVSSWVQDDRDVAALRQALEKWVAQGCFEGLKSETRFTVETATIGYYQDRVLDRKRGVVNFQSTLVECKAVADALNELHKSESVNPYSCEWKQIEPYQFTNADFDELVPLPSLAGMIPDNVPISSLPLNDIYKATMRTVNKKLSQSDQKTFIFTVWRDE